MGDMTVAQPLIDPDPDSAPLAWVAGEIRAAVESAIGGVRRFLADGGDTGVLREAREQAHQASGALRMLDLRGAVRLLDASEDLLKRWENEPAACEAAAAAKFESALRALIAYLEGVRAGRADQPIRLFPHYRDLRQLAGAARAHPADLLFPDLTRRPALAAIGVLPMTADQLRVRRVRFEGALLRFLRDPSSQEARRDMRDALFDLERLPQRGLARSFWWVVRGLLDALEADGLAVDTELKRVLARVNLQLRRLIEGSGGVAERLLVDALYYIGRADARVARVAEARQLYDLDALLPADYERSKLVLLGADQIRDLRRTLAEAKSALSEAAAGGGGGSFAQHLEAARGAAAALELAPIEALLTEIARLAAGLPDTPVSSREALAIEIATAMLLVDLGVDELPNLDERFEGRAHAMTERLHAAQRGEAPATVDPWLSELARKAQDRLTMQTVIGEMNGLLREVEQRLDRFFRSPEQREDLGTLDGSIEQMGSVLALLGFDDVAAALDDARATVRLYADPAVAASEADFARLAANLGAVGFFIGSLQQESESARGRFRWDPHTRAFSADMAASGRPDAAEDEDEDPWALYAGEAEEEDHGEENVESSAGQHLQQARELAARLAADAADASAARQLLEVTQRLANDADLLDDAALKSLAREAADAARRLIERPDAALADKLAATLAPTTVEPPAPPPATPLPQSQAAADEELLSIFVEEAAEVLTGIDEQLDALRAARGDRARLTTVRRAFHTLKGSSRMVGLAQFGEGAWAVEQCFNAWLSQERDATEDLIALAAASRAVMADWVDRIHADAAAAIDPQPLIEAAHRVRDGQPFEIDPAYLPMAAGITEAAAEIDVLEAIEGLLAQPEEPAKEGALAAEAALEVPPPEMHLAEPVADELRADATTASEPSPAEAAGMAAPALEEPAPQAEPLAADEELRRIGPVAISHGLYGVFLSEADDLVRALGQDIAEWRFEPQRPASTTAVRCAHSLAGITGTVGLATVWALAEPLDDLLHELSQAGATEAPPFDLMQRVIERIRGMLHQFAADIYPPASPADEDAIGEMTAAVQALRERAAPEAEAVAAPPATAIAPDAVTPSASPAEALDFATAAQTGPHESLAEAAPPAGEPTEFPAEVVPAEAEPHDVHAEVAPAEGEPHEFRAEAAPAEAEPHEIHIEAVPEEAEPHEFRVEAAPEESPATAAMDAEAAAETAERAGSEAEPLAPGAGMSLASPAEPPAAEAPWPDDGAAGTDAPQPPPRVVAATAAEPPTAEATEAPGAITVADELDPDLLPVFLVEAGDLLPTVGSQLRTLAAHPGERAPLRELMRLLHTVKGSARMAGAMRLGELAHGMETRIEAATALPQLPADLCDDLLARYDLALTLFEGLQRGESVPLPTLGGEPSAAAAPVGTQAVAERAPVAEHGKAEAEETAAEAAAAQLYVRVRADVLDRLVDQAGEVLIARSRVENHTTTVKSALADLNDNIHRLRSQMRELEIQAEAQIQARSEKLAQESAGFDPLEFDRFTRLQELTRMIAESIEDVATIQSSMLKGLQTSEADLSAQYRLTRELQQQLMRVRLVPFSSVAERIYRVARQSAKELGKRVNVDIRGGKTELDRVVLERMAAPLEHMVRNAIVHGLEAPAARRAAGKPETGELRLEVRQEGNEIVLTIADDGAGLDLAKIRARAHASGVLRADQQPSDRELMELIFAPGFSTATEVTELAGRGVGLDVVRSELAAFGGRIAIASETGHGTRFTLNLPLTLAVTQVVLASVGGRRYAIPAGMVEHVTRLHPEDVAEAITEGLIEMPGTGTVALRTMAQLLGEDMTLREGRQVPVLLLRSGDDRMAVVADEVSANQEVVVKNVGPQVARLAGILGATILGNGEIVLIVNPVQLIVRAPEPPRLSHAAAVSPPEASPRAQRAGEAGVTLTAAPLVMVVDDSLTVRRVTQRLLERSGYEVLLAKDGVDALRQLQDVRPDVMLVDIEMPRMDGFDLTRHVRGTELTRSIPIVMITSRTADKHRRMALELGVNAYLGKPYQDDELLALLRSFVKERSVV